MEQNTNKNYQSKIKSLFIKTTLEQKEGIRFQVELLGYLEKSPSQKSQIKKGERKPSDEHAR